MSGAGSLLRSACHTIIKQITVPIVSMTMPRRFFFQNDCSSFTRDMAAFLNIEGALINSHSLSYCTGMAPPVLIWTRPSRVGGVPSRRILKYGTSRSSDTAMLWASVMSSSLSSRALRSSSSTPEWLIPIK